MPTVEVQRADITLYEAPSQATGAPVLVLGPHDPESWKVLIHHARFPQGLPEDFDRHAPGAP